MSMSSWKYLVVLALLAIAAFAVFSTPKVAATPLPSPEVHGWWIVLEDLDGLRINPDNYPEVEEVLIMVWNESANCLIAYYKGPATDTGNYTLNLVWKYEIVDKIPTPQYGTYNVTILLKAYGRWLLFNWSDDIDPNGITATELESYYNETVASWHWWRLNFTAVTNIQDPKVFNVTLYNADPEDHRKEDLAHFKVFWGDTGELLWERDAEGGWGSTLNATAERTFNISDTWVEISYVGLEGCYHIDAVHNVTLVKETWWKLYKNPGETLDVLVGNATLEFTYILYSWNDIHLNETDLISGWEVEYNITYYAQNDPAGDGHAMFSWWDTIADLGGVYLPPVVPVFPDAWNWTFADKAYTLLINISLYDICGDEKTVGDWPPVKAVIQWSHDGKTYIVRSGEARAWTNYVPSHGFHPWGDERAFLWIPDITRIYGDNVTLTIEELTVQIFTINFNTTDLLLGTYSWMSPLFFYDDLGYPVAAAYNMVTAAPGAANYTFVGIHAITSQVPARVVVKDSEPTAQPLEGAYVIIQAQQMDPINTVSTTDGEVYLPPFWILAGGGTASGEPIQARMGSSPGWLPVPMQFRTSATNFTYRFRVFWSLPSAGATEAPGESPAVEVTPDDNTLEINLTAIVERVWFDWEWDPVLHFVPWGTCEVQEKVLSAKVYELKIRIVDLCYRPLTPLDYPDILALLTYKVTDFTGTERTVMLPAAGIDYEGTLFIGKVPGGTFEIKLYFKGMVLDPVNETKTITLEGNIVEAPTFVFPVGDFAPQITQWDAPEALLNISVWLQIYKDGRPVWEEPVVLTNCTGHAVFEKIPMKPADTDHEYAVYLVAETNEQTPYIRPQDAGLLVMNYSVLDLLEEKMDCVVTDVFPAWIYSFRAVVVDHAGRVLTTLKTDVGDYPVIFAIVDTTYGEEFPLWLYCTQFPCYCVPNITVDFRIINATASEYDDDFNALRPGMVADTEEAVFLVSSSQTNILVTGEEGDKDRYPHLFVAGATFHVVVWDGGVLVYNYTITLPRPYQTGVVFFNETDYTSWTIFDHTELNYTWILDTEGRIAHPILRFTGSKNWTSGGERYDTKLEFVTWEQTLEVYTLSNAGDYAVPKLNLTLVRNDVINITTFAKDASSFEKMYVNLTDIANRFIYWAKDYPTTMGNLTSYAWNAVDEDGDGKIVIRVPVWLPVRDGTFWTETLWAGPDPLKFLGLKFGASIPYAYVLAGEDWGSPSVPNTPHNYEFCVYIDNSLGNAIWHHIFGYVVNWNHTHSFVEWWTTDDDGDRVFYAKWYKAGEEFYGINDYWLGDWWNMTYWSGAAKVVHTIAMDQFCVDVLGPDKLLRLEPLANQPVNVTPIAYIYGVSTLERRSTGEELGLPYEWGPEYTDENGRVVFKPKTGATVTLPDGSTVPLAVDHVAYKFDVDYAGSTTINAVAFIEYKVETWINYADLLEKYAEVAGMDKTEFEEEVIPVTEWRVLFDYVNFTLAHEDLDECVELKWAAMLFHVEDWNGRPVRNQLATLWPKYLNYRAGTYTYAGAIAVPAAMNFTDAEGLVLLYVPPTVTVYDEISDTWFTGTPYYELKVYWLDTFLLREAGALEKSYDIYASSADPVYGERYYAPGEGTTIQVFVYTGTFRLVGVDGLDLPAALLNKITVEISWPDGAVTKHTPGSEGTVEMIMKSDNIIGIDTKRVKKAPDLVASIRKALNPESPVPQTVEGDYVVTIKIGDEVVATKTLRVHKARTDFPELVITPEEVVLAVARDVTIKLTTPFGTPMAGAEVEVAGKAVEIVGTAGTYTADEEGRVYIPFAILSKRTEEKTEPYKITITVKKWRGMDVGYSTEVDAAPQIDITVPKIGKLTVKVVGSRGQGIAGADVTIAGPITIKGATDASGVFETELVEGSWTVTAEKGGKKATTSPPVTVTGGKITEVELRLDIFLTVAGWELSMSDFTGLILLVIILVIVLFIIAHEYSVWRRKRIAKALVPAKPE